MNTKKPKPEKIPVVVRRFDGELIALFPTVPADRNGYNVESYMFVGQHGGADPGNVMRKSQPVPKEEAEAFVREYAANNYDEDHPVEYVLRRKCTYRHYLIRMEEVKRVRNYTSDPLEPHDRMVGN